jgi:hypothetical protein
MKIDDRIDLARRRQFSGELRKLPLEDIEHLQDCINGNETEEFYAGVLAGLAAATTLVQSGLADAVPKATAAIADLCEKREYAT